MFPFYPLVYYYLGLINLAEKDFSTAKTNLTKALTQDPNLFAARYDLARAYLGLGEYKAAYNRLKQAKASLRGIPRSKRIYLLCWLPILNFKPKNKRKRPQPGKLPPYLKPSPSLKKLQGWR